MILGLGVGVLVYAAFVFDLFGFMARDELWLRLLMLAASMLYLVYYFIVAGTPLWDALITNGALALVNLVMIGVVIYERTTFSMSAEDSAIYRQFPMMSPGQFRRFLKLATRIEGQQTLTVDAEPVERLYFLHHGHARIIKHGADAVIGPDTFVGEIAFVTGNPASATVELEPGGQALAWRFEDLKKLFDRRPALKTALVAHLNIDLVRKVTVAVLPDPNPLFTSSRGDGGDPRA